MPGLFGFTGGDRRQLDKMADAMMRYEHFSRINPFHDSCFYCGAIHNNVLLPTVSIEPDGAVAVWVDGEFYNLLKVVKNVNLPLSSEPLTAASLLAEAYRRQMLTQILKVVDGIFSAVIYDKCNNKVLLISDRFGMRNLYYSFRATGIVWGAEVKALLSLDDVDRAWNRQSFECFMELGYLLEDNTWFENIKLLGPALILEYKIDERKAEFIRYWRWSDIQPQRIGFDDAVDKAADLMIESVKCRFDLADKFGISLSGGLDSRLIFAIVNRLYPEYKSFAYTMGVENCNDIRIAKIVASKSSCTHLVYNFDEYNWFLPRFRKVIDTDGMLDIQHMHGSEFLPDIATKVNTDLNGYAGDAVLGGSFLKPDLLDKRINREIASQFYREFSGACNVEDSFYDLAHFEPHIYMNRVRRFTNMGIVNGQSFLKYRKPFFSNSVVDFSMSIPDSFRLNNKLYGTMLARHFPSFYKDIPWQKTGWPISIDCPAGDAPVEIVSELELSDDKAFINYAKLIREPSVATLLVDVLGDSNACYKNFTKVDYFNDFLMLHLNNKEINRCNKILRLLTCEVYFRHVIGSVGDFFVDNRKLFG